jgi:hypothetical protein
MKKLIIFAMPLLVLMFCGAASAQISANVTPMQIPDHPLHAEPHDLAIERPIVGQGPNTYTYAQGERPLWEFPNPEQVAPLGDIARAYRQKKLAVKKATTVFEKEGS